MSSENTLGAQRSARERLADLTEVCRCGGYVCRVCFEWNKRAPLSTTILYVPLDVSNSLKYRDLESFWLHDLSNFIHRLELHQQTC